jgi:solute carrier family 25 phosphate transporter 23/24/25/41
VLFQGDVSLSAEDKPPTSPSPSTYRVLTLGSHSGLATSLEPNGEGEDEEYDYFDEDQVEEEGQRQLHEGHSALKFLLAGGAAGAGELTLHFHTDVSPQNHIVSRSCTAPFDRLKIFLITRPPELGGTKGPGVKAIAHAITRIYSEGGVLAFWTGNGLSVAKIFPESAIKFFAYESAVSTISSLKGQFSLLENLSIFGRNGRSRNTTTRWRILVILAALVDFSLVELVESAAN